MKQYFLPNILSKQGSVDECVKVWDPENMVDSLLPVSSMPASNKRHMHDFQDKPKHSFQDHEFAVTGLGSPCALYSIP